jgi:hypothetical protein
MTVHRRTSIWSTVVLLIAITLGSCGPVSLSARPTESFCSGVTTDIGGCDPVPSFVATTCETLAGEFGTAIDRAMLDILNGPDSVAGDGRSVRIQHRGILITTALTDRMIGLGILRRCTMPVFLDHAATAFSADMKARIGAVLYDGSPPATYEEFIDRLGRIMSGIGRTP